MVLFHKFVKNIGAQNSGPRDGNDDVIIKIDQVVSFYHGIQECQTTCFPTDRPIADPGKIQIFIELVAVEFCNHTTAFVHPELPNGIIQIPPDLILVLKILDLKLSEKICQRKQCPGPKPF